MRARFRETFPMTASPRRQLLARTALCGVLAATVATAANPALALDFGGNVVSTGSNGGAVTGSTAGGVTTVTVGGSRAVINWNNFNVANGETVNFQFGNRDDLVVNRVLGGGQASINGVLNGCLGVCNGSNYGGNVWVLSSGGVLLGANARINTGGFLAATGDLADADILDGDLNFSFSGAPDGSKVEALAGAQITAYGGALAFIAPVVTMQAGSNVAGLNGGDVLYGSASNWNVTFARTATDDLDLITFQVPTANDGAGGTTGITLNGVTTANQVYAAAVSKTGVTSNILLGGSITATTAASENGDIVLSAANGAVTGTGLVRSMTSAVVIDAKSVDLATVNAGGSLSINTAGDLRVASATAGDDMSLIATGGALVVRNINMMGTGAGRDLTVRAGGHLTLGADAPLDVAGTPNFSQAGTGATIIQSTGGSAKVHLDVANGAMTRLTAVTADGDVSIGVRTGDVHLGNVASANGSASIQARGASVTLTGTLSAAQDITFNASQGDLATLIAGRDLDVTTFSSLAVRSAQAGDDASFLSSSAATVRAVTLTGAGADLEGNGSNLSLRGLAGATLGADNEAGITSSNAFTRLAGTGSASVTSMNGGVKVYLNRSEKFTTLGGEYSFSRASVDAVVTSGDLSIDTLSAVSSNLKAANVLRVGAVQGLNGDYSVTAADFSGAALNPTGSILNLSITDTQGGLVLSNNLTAGGKIEITTANGGTLTSLGTLTANGFPGSVTLTGTGITAAGIVASGDVTLNGGTGLVSVSSLSVGRDYRLTGGSFSSGALTPLGDRTGSWFLQDTLGDLNLAAQSLNYVGDIVLNTGGVLNGMGPIVSTAGSITIMAQVVNLPTVNAAKSVSVSSAGDLRLNYAAAGDDLRLFSNGGALVVREINMTGAGTGRDFIVQASGDVTLGADAPIIGAGGPTFTRAGTGMTTIASTSGSANIHFDAPFTSTTRLGAVTANSVSIGVKGGRVELENVTARTGSISIQGMVANIVATGSINAAMDVNINTYGVNATSIVAGRDINASVSQELLVGLAQAGDDIFLVSSSGAATVRAVTLTGAGVDVGNDGFNLQLGGSSRTTLGADNEAGITTANTFKRLSGTGYTSISTMIGPVNVYLSSSEAINTLSAGGMFPSPPNTVNAVVTSGDLSIGNLSAKAASLKAANLLRVGAIQNLSGDYSVTAADFAGIALAPTGTANNVTIIDTAGGLTLSSAIAATGKLTIQSAGPLTVSGALSGAGGVLAESHGGMTLAAGGSIASTATGNAIVLASDGDFTNNAGPSALAAANGRWLVYTQAVGQPTAPANNDFGGLAGKSFYGSTYDFATDGFSTAPGAGNRFVYGYRPTLTVTPVSQTVTYDGTIPTVSALITGLVNGDLAADAWSGSPLISGANSKNVGGYALLASLGSLASDLNYGFAFGSGLLTINPKTLTGVLTANNKTYDGNTAATGSINLIGVVVGDQVSAGGTYSFDDRNAGTGKTVTASGVALTGADAGNYNLLPLAAAIADILRKDVSGLLTAQNKTYDGTTAATGSIGLTGVIAGDQVSAGGTYAFADKTAGTGKTVTASGVALTGADAGNYNLLPLAAAIADILRKDVSGLLTAQNKTYDGTTAATGSIGLTGVIAGDQVSAGGTYAFADRNAGTDKSVTATGVTLSGVDAGNYVLTGVGGDRADILRRLVTISADNISKHTGQPDPVLTWRVSSGSVVGGDTVTGHLVRDPGDAVGTYLIGRGDLGLSANYELTFTSGSFEIRPMPGDGQDGTPPLRFLNTWTLGLDKDQSSRLTIIDERGEGEEEDKPGQ